MSVTLQQVIQKGTEYESCVYCEKHPDYPNISPVTLHENGKCLICGSKSSKNVS